MKTRFQRKLEERSRHTLYHPSFEHDACGTGFVADISGKPSHAIVEKGIEAVVNLTHRGATDADRTLHGAGDGRDLDARDAVRDRLRGESADVRQRDERRRRGERPDLFEKHHDRS